MRRQSRKYLHSIRTKQKGKERKKKMNHIIHSANLSLMCGCTMEEFLAESSRSACSFESCEVKGQLAFAKFAVANICRFGLTMRRISAIYARVSANLRGIRNILRVAGFCQRNKHFPLRISAARQLFGFPKFSGNDDPSRH